MAMSLLHPPPICTFTNRRRRYEQVTRPPAASCVTHIMNTKPYQTQHSKLISYYFHQQQRCARVVRAALITNEDTSSAFSASDFPLFQTPLTLQPTAASQVRSIFSEYLIFEPENYDYFF